jgi:hypothetical protein
MVTDERSEIVGQSVGLEGNLRRAIDFREGEKISLEVSLQSGCDLLGAKQTDPCPGSPGRLRKLQFLLAFEFRSCRRLLQRLLDPANLDDHVPHRVELRLQLGLQCGGR